MDKSGMTIRPPAGGICPVVGFLTIALLALPPLHAATPAVAQSRTAELTGRALSSTPDAERGARLFLKSCSGCHRKDAAGSDDRAVPAIAAQHPSYLVKQMAAFIEFEREDDGQHRVLAQAELSRPQSLTDLAAYLGSLPARPAATPPATIGDRSMEDGESLYVDMCSNCHLAQAQGDAEHFIPALHGQHYSYLLMQLRRFAHGHRFDTPDELLQMFDGMTSAQMEAVASYLAHLPAPPVRTAAR